MKILRKKNVLVGPRDYLGNRTWEIAVGDARKRIREIPDCSVDVVVTSPAYWALRNYDDQDAQMGSEPSIFAWVDAHVSLFRDVRRILKDHGTLGLNVGDSYAQSGRGAIGSGVVNDSHHPFGRNRRNLEQSRRSNFSVKGNINGNRSREITGERVAPGFKPKDLLGQPWRLAFALHADGWYFRSDIVWFKPNPMPESILDRPTKSHEYVFLFSKSERYYYDAEAVREPYKPSSLERRQYIDRGGHTGDRSGEYQPGGPIHDPENREGKFYGANAAGRNLRDVWEINSEPFRGAHFATFPTALVRRPILAGSSQHGVCVSCGKPYVRIIAKGAHDLRHAIASGGDENGEYHGASEKHLAFDASLDRLKRRQDSQRPAVAAVQNPSEVKARILAGMRERRTQGWRPSCHRQPCPRCKGSGDLVVPAVGNLPERVDPCASCDASGWWWSSCAEEASASTAFVGVTARSNEEIAAICGTPTVCCGHPVGDHGFDRYTCSRCNCVRLRVTPAEGTAFTVIPATVFDPFSGAATTGVEARRLGRYYRGIELSPRYGRMSARRLERDAARLSFGGEKPKTEAEARAQVAQGNLFERSR